MPSDEPDAATLKFDRRVLLAFGVLAVLLFLLAFAALPFARVRPLNLLEVFLTGLMGAFFVLGIPVFLHARKRGIIPTKKILIVFAAISPVAAVVLAPAIPVFPLGFGAALIDLDLSDPIMLTVFAIVLWLSGFLLALALLFVGFGMSGVLSAVQRRVAPDILLLVRGMTVPSGRSAKQGGAKPKRLAGGVGWLFGVPDVLDSRALAVTMGHPKTAFPWPVFRRALGLELLFGMIVVVYVSLNPILLDSVDSERLFTLSTSLANLVPLLVLSWFLYDRLNARIPGPMRDFRLYKGLRSRVLTTFVAFSTILIIVRVGLQEVSLTVFLQSFAAYYVLFLGLALLFSFVYFNYFEEDLARDVARTFDAKRAAQEKAESSSVS